MTKVFGIGLNKTGTTTLTAALKELGYRICPEAHGYALCALPTEPVYGLCEVYSGFADYPWFLPLHYQTLSYLYPHSKFILTIRDPEKWWESLNRWVTLFKMDLKRNYVLQSYLSSLDKETAIAQFLEHNDIAWNFFKDSDKLLVVNWEIIGHWDEICGFLGKEVPDVPFPHKNRFNHKTGKYEG